MAGPLYEYCGYKVGCSAQGFLWEDVQRGTWDPGGFKMLGKCLLVAESHWTAVRCWKVLTATAAWRRISV